MYVCMCECIVLQHDAMMGSIGVVGGKLKCIHMHARTPSHACRACMYVCMYIYMYVCVHYVCNAWDFSVQSNPHTATHCNKLKNTATHRNSSQHTDSAGKFVIGRFLREIVGVNIGILSKGKRAGVLSAIEPFSEDGRKWFENSLDTTYTEFLTKVAMGRGPQVHTFNRSL